VFAQHSRMRARVALGTYPDCRWRGQGSVTTRLRPKSYSIGRLYTRSAGNGTREYLIRDVCISCRTSKEPRLGSALKGSCGGFARVFGSGSKSSAFAGASIIEFRAYLMRIYDGVACGISALGFHPADWAARKGDRAGRAGPKIRADEIFVGWDYFCGGAGANPGSRQVFLEPLRDIFDPFTCFDAVELETFISRPRR
jgi:hypothetical protein